jgi:hypothetical protein
MAKKNKFEDTLLLALENAKYDRDLTGQFLNIYRKDFETQEETDPEKSLSAKLNYATNLTKLIEALTRSNEQIIKIAESYAKNDKSSLGEAEEKSEEQQREEMYVLFEKEDLKK